MTVSSIAIANAPDDVQIQYCMEQHLLPPEERSEDYYYILRAFSLDELPKELRGPELRQLPASGELSLAEIGEEGGITVGDEVRINSAACRDLIGKANSAQMAFSEWYGASNVPPINWDAGVVYGDGAVSRFYQDERYGTAACRSISVRSNTTYYASSMGCRKQGSVPFEGQWPSTRGQARPCLWNNTKSNGGPNYSAFKYFKFKAGSAEGECANTTWNTSSYVTTNPGYPDTTRYYSDANGMGVGEALWNALNTDVPNITFWFGNDA